MARLYPILLLLCVLGGVGYLAYQYYASTQERIAILTANNAKLETAHKQTVVEFEQYRVNVKEEIDKFKKELEKQQKLNEELNNNLEEVKANNKIITQLLAENDIIKNSLADPAGQEKRINEQVNKMFSGINSATK